MTYTKVMFAEAAQTESSSFSQTVIAAELVLTISVGRTFWSSGTPFRVANVLLNRLGARRDDGLLQYFGWYRRIKILFGSNGILQTSSSSSRSSVFGLAQFHHGPGRIAHRAQVESSILSQTTVSSALRTEHRSSRAFSARRPSALHSGLEYKSSMEVLEGDIGVRGQSWIWKFTKSFLSNELRHTSTVFFIGHRFRMRRHFCANSFWTITCLGSSIAPIRSGQSRA